MADTIPTPPPLRQVQINTTKPTVRHQAKSGWFGAFAVTAFFTVLGVSSGYFAGHHFPLWGGINLMGEPGSPAHDAVVRSHIVGCGLIGLAIGFATIVVSKLAIK